MGTILRQIILVEINVKYKNYKFSDLKSLERVIEMRDH